jgi:lambda repressor-like predicted transcriptional regulator
VSVAISYDPDFSSTICDGLREDRLEAFVKARWPKINKILDCDFGASMLSVHPQIITKSREGPRRKPKL